MTERNGHGPTVLVVEDFEDNRFMMRRLLEMSGYRVVEAVNSEQAVEAAEKERPDLILMGFVTYSLQPEARASSSARYAGCRSSASSGSPTWSPASAP